MPSQQVLVGCEVDLKCFCLAEKAVLGQFAKAAAHANTDLELSR